MKNAAEKFGEFLKSFRQKRAKSLRGFCRDMDIDPSNWSKYEKGKISFNVDPKHIMNFCKFFEIKIGSQDYHELFQSVAQFIQSDAEERVKRLSDVMFR